MFSYFGSKTCVAHLYPPPRYPLIIEPFAGAAKYALHYPDRQVWLNDYDAMLARAWQWIINVTQEEIDALPRLRPGENLNQWCKDHGRYLSGPARWFVSKCLCRGRATGGVTYTGWAAEDGALEIAYARLRKFQGRLTHWKITDMDYRELPNIEATWFIDPPYQVAGHNYIHHKLDYKELGRWCRSRKGQVIVCEGPGADWLPFKRFVRTGKRHGWEYIWTRGCGRNVQPREWVENVFNARFMKKPRIRAG